MIERMQLHIHMKSGNTITVDVTKFESKRDPLTGLQELTWITPGTETNPTRTALSYIDMTQVEGLSETRIPS